jgi:hypothetical protein
MDRRLIGPIASLVAVEWRKTVHYLEWNPDFSTL